MTAPTRERRLRNGFRWNDDAGSLPIALLLTFVGMALSSLLIPMLLTQLSATRSAVQRTHALHAAQAGMDVAIGYIRAAANAGGTIDKLPCYSTASPLTGKLVGGTARYWVTIEYVDVDDSTPIACHAKTPSYARIVSRGDDNSTKPINTVRFRELRATYRLRTTNANLAGGLIHIYKTATSKDLCMDAGTALPVAGAPVQMQLCQPGSAQQIFTYNEDLTLSLVSSRTTTVDLGMCLDAGAHTTPPSTGIPVLFRACGPPPGLPQQQWSINDSANFEGTNGLVLDGFCLAIQTQDLPGSPLVLRQTCGGGYDNIRTWSPDPAAGAGAAGEVIGPPAANVRQLVNFSQFGRCLDVTEGNLTYGYLIAWPCKQAPNAVNVLWNQKFAMPLVPADTDSAAGRITTNPGVLQCLKSPLTTAAGNYVTVVPCTSPTDLNWTVFGLDTKGNYEPSYRIMDTNKNCLSVTDPAAAVPDLYPNGQQISKIVMAVCSASNLQKWNAPAYILQPTPLKDVGEK